MGRVWTGVPRRQRARLVIVTAVLGFWAVVLLLGCLGHTHVLWNCLQFTLGPSAFVLLCVGGIPEDQLVKSSASAPEGWMRTLSVLAMFVVTSGVSAYPYVVGLVGAGSCEPPHGDPDDPDWSKALTIYHVDATAGWITASIAMFCVGASHQPSLYVRSAVRFLVAIWFEGVTWTLVAVISLCGNPNDHQTQMGRSTGRDLGFFINSAAVLWLSFLVLRRVEVLDIIFGSSEGFAPVVFGNVTQQLAVCFGVLCLLQVTANISSTIALHSGLYAYDAFGSCTFILACFAMLACFVHVLSAFYKPVKILFDEAKEASDITATDALWAARCLRLERNAILISMLATACDLAMRSILGFWHKGIANSVGGFVTYITLWDLRDILDAASIAVLCGFFGKGTREDIGRQPSQCELVQTFDKRKCDLTRHPASSDPRWACKVEELAGRGFELSSLLRFYEELLQGDLMPDFDPLRSTTNDVVRQAIIPLSRDQPPGTGGRALASVWNKGEAVWPERMVTHSWSNLFLHLVAAIVDDALGVEIYYDRLAMQLCSVKGLRQVRRQLDETDGHVITYWVCAFSVNQHVGICGGFGNPPSNPIDHEKWMQKRVDTVTRKPHPICECSERKFFSDEPVLCEMNKFDDMLDLLMQRMPSFQHVIAMDGKFDLLKRCWCLAEIMRTSNAEAPQNTLMFSAESMDSHYDALKDLDVQECDATNEEDKKFILSKIPSFDHFNAKLKWLVFNKEGIFNRQLNCPVDRMQAAARVASRVHKSRAARGGLPTGPAPSASARPRTGRPRLRTWPFPCRSASSGSEEEEDMEGSSTEEGSSSA